MKINILTLFPAYFKSSLESSIIKRAISSNIIQVNIINIRDFSTDAHKTTDDRPFGGGPGMVMKIEPIDLALSSINATPGTQNKKILATALFFDDYHLVKL